MNYKLWQFICLIAILIFMNILLAISVKAQTINVSLEIIQSMTEEEFYESLKPVSSDCDVPILNTCVNF